MHTDLVKLLAVSSWLLAYGLFANSPYRQCIVEVLGILGVDGTGKHLAEVLATGYLLRGDAWINLLGCLLYMLGIGIGQSILRKDGMHLDIIIAFLT